MDTPDIIPASQFKPDPIATKASSTPDVIPAGQFKPDEDTYGSIGQQALAGLEGFGRGISLGTSDLAEAGLGLSTPEAIKARMRENPITSGVGNLAGAGTLISGTGGLMAPAEAAVGEAGYAASALGAAGEGALFGAGSAVSDYALGDPNLNTQKVMSDIGFGTLIGAGAGVLGQGLKGLIGKFGNPKGSLPETVASESDEVNKAAETQNAIQETADHGLKTNAPEVVEAANRQGLPVMIGQVSQDPWVQKAEDSLINGAPSYSGLRRARLYEDGYNQAVDKLSDVLPAEGFSKAQLGEALKDNLTAKIDQEAEPFNALYDQIHQDTEVIPLKDKSAPSIAKNILKELTGPEFGKNDTGAKFATNVADEIQDLKTVDQLRQYQSNLNKRLSPLASPAEKRVVAIVQDKLDRWERSTIKGYAEKFINKDLSDPEQAQIWGDKVETYKTLLSRIDETDAKYAPFRQKIGELSEWLGKGKIQGAKHAIQFIDGLEPEDIANKLAQKKYSGLYKFLDQHFPEEGALVKQYQKSVFRDVATKTGEFHPKVLFNKINELEPEVKNAIFAPDEVQKLDDLETYIRSFPKNFNPSGTSGMSAFREFFKSPEGAILGNARDLLIEGYIKAKSGLADISPYQAGNEAAQKLNQYQAIMKMVHRSNQEIAQGIHALAGGATSALTNKFNLSDEDYDKVTKRIEALAQNQNALSDHLDTHTFGLTEHLPNVTQSFGNSLTTQIQFLNSKIPRPNNPSLKVQGWKPSPIQKLKFKNSYGLVEKPTDVLLQIKKGELTSEGMEALASCHPDLLKEMQNKINNTLSPEEVHKLPYSIKQGLSLFLGAPVESSLLQPIAASNQATFQMPGSESDNQKMMAAPRSSAGIKNMKVSERAQTRTQELEQRDV